MVPANHVRVTKVLDVKYYMIHSHNYSYCFQSLLVNRPSILLYRCIGSYIPCQFLPSPLRSMPCCLLIIVLVCRSYCFLLQGTWFYQIAFTLYPPSNKEVTTWDLEEMENIMVVTLIYSWHIIGCMMGKIF